MKIAFSPTIHDYRGKVESLLLKKEASNNLMLGLMDYFKTTISKDVYFGYVEEDGEIIYAFMQTPPNNWILADIDVDHRVIVHIANFLYKKAIKVPGVLGPVSKAEVFVGEWKQRKKVDAKVHMNQLIYQLDEVNVQIDTNGQMLKATKADHPLVKSWLIHFGKEANEAMTEIKASQMATKFIENGTAFLWNVAGIPVSMANQSRKTKNGASINAVYTPDEHKRNGYATNLVAALSQKLLHDGFAFCSLYTDKANPTSNSIYKKIGYNEVGSSIVYHFYN
ncbi:GNAT family N-acetyltransferase [Oceanobacillus bengalensis]|uniref:GNAT family N-acetyltransferase n=1 Tax=Oceanobacillus bengalensis TaxID=1435466 RepID=A0A494Z085_9BACI|nr:GNAT family N-acetyltransferase [Oceanobacillus bengalensis]RKQ15902.1 GNAT family N-acetyltransferase [Oceanobacillus bengalensis]